MKILFIINPISGNHRFQSKTKRIGDKIEQYGLSEKVDYYYTSAHGDAYQKSLSLKSDMYDLLIAVGGDGTINEVIRGLMESSSKISLAILPAGTSNDFAGFTKLPTTPEKFCKAIKLGKYRNIDIGRANGQHFINVFCGGSFMDIPYGVKQRKKARWGRIAYYFQALKDCKKGFSSSWRLTFDCDGEQFTEDVLFFTLTNSGQAGGYAGLTPYADIGDGKMDLCIIKKTDLIQFPARVIWYTLKKNDTPHVIYRQVEKLHIDGEACEGIPLDVDGEDFDYQLPVDITVCHNAISLLVSQ